MEDRNQCSGCAVGESFRAVALVIGMAGPAASAQVAPALKPP